MKILDFGNGADKKPNTINVDLHPYKGIDFIYDGIEMPIKDDVFDLILSEQVMEHCFFIDDYYRETARILKPDGSMMVSFPHRFVPYDSHSRTWFIHWFFPKWYHPDYLNWKTKGYHKRIVKKYFRVVKDISKSIAVNYNIYDGPKILRRIANYIPGLGYFRQAHWELRLK